MKLRMSARGVELSAELNEYIRRRVHFSLGRFAGRIQSVSISLADVNGPRGGLDKICDVRVNAGLRNPLMVRERQGNVHAAVAFAVERAERALRRQLQIASRTDRAKRGRTAARTFKIGDSARIPVV